MQYLDELNTPQKEAVLHTDGPLAIIAGAGSGKTKVLTTRIAFLIEQGIEPYNILALTFTNKAAREMVERVESMIHNTSVRSLFIGTFHSIFARILRVESEKLGFPRDFTIYDTDDARSVLKNLIKARALDEKVYKPKLVLNRISAAKNMLLSPQAYAETPEIVGEDEKAGLGQIAEIYKEYVQTCFKNGAMDFDDLLVKMYELLVRFPEVLQKYQHKFRYIMIDEYQDTNGAQYHIIQLLAQAHGNLVVVGDDAQSIYSFRGATIQNILQFKSDYPDAPIVKLEQNYRSTGYILQAANKVITNNASQIPKNLWTDKEEGSKIQVMGVMTDTEESKIVANTISEEKLRNHYQNKDFAILYRTNAQSRAFEEALRRAAIPYRIYGGLSFYSRKEIKDMLAYLRLLVNPKDDESLRRIINYPARGIGNTSMQRITEAARNADVSLMEVVQDPQNYNLSGAVLSRLSQFATMVNSVASGMEKRSAYDVAYEMAKESGLLKALSNTETAEDRARFENIQELLNAIQEASEKVDENGEVIHLSLGEYLQEITLLTDADQEDDDPNTVKLMTVHAAKGLEFPNVFLVGLEENLFPSQLSMYDVEDLEEERRLFYVAITRAERNLWIYYSNMRYRFGNLITNQPSRFIQELPASAVQHNSKSPQNSVKSIDLSKPIHFKDMLSRKSKPSYEHAASANFAADDPSTLVVGDKVEHLKFGFGEIMDMEGGQNNRMASIQFEKGENKPKKIMLKFAKLRKVT